MASRASYRSSRGSNMIKALLSTKDLRDDEAGLVEYMNLGTTELCTKGLTEEQIGVLQVVGDKIDALRTQFEIVAEEREALRQENNEKETELQRLSEKEMNASEERCSIMSREIDRLKEQLRASTEREGAIHMELTTLRILQKDLEDETANHLKALQTDHLDLDNMADILQSLSDDMTRTNAFLGHFAGTVPPPPDLSVHPLASEIQTYLHLCSSLPDVFVNREPFERYAIEHEQDAFASLVGVEIAECQLRTRLCRDETENRKCCIDSLNMLFRYVSRTTATMLLDEQYSRASISSNEADARKTTWEHRACVEIERTARDEELRRHHIQNDEAGSRRSAGDLYTTMQRWQHAAVNTARDEERGRLLVADESDAARGTLEQRISLLCSLQAAAEQHFSTTASEVIRYEEQERQLVNNESDAVFAMLNTLQKANELHISNTVTDIVHHEEQARQLIAESEDAMSHVLEMLESEKAFASRAAAEVVGEEERGRLQNIDEANAARSSLEQRIALLCSWQTAAEQHFSTTASEVIRYEEQERQLVNNESDAVLAMLNTLQKANWLHISNSVTDIVHHEERERQLVTENEDAMSHVLGMLESEKIHASRATSDIFSNEERGRQLVADEVNAARDALEQRVTMLCLLQTTKEQHFSNSASEAIINEEQGRQLLHNESDAAFQSIATLNTLNIHISNSVTDIVHREEQARQLIAENETAMGMLEFEKSHASKAAAEVIGEEERGRLQITADETNMAHSALEQRIAMLCSLQAAEERHFSNAASEVVCSEERGRRLTSCEADAAHHCLEAMLGMLQETEERHRSTAAAEVTHNETRSRLHIHDDEEYTRNQASKHHIKTMRLLQAASIHRTTMAVENVKETEERGRNQVFSSESDAREHHAARLQELLKLEMCHLMKTIQRVGCDETQQRLQMADDEASVRFHLSELFTTAHNRLHTLQTRYALQAMRDASREEERGRNQVQCDESETVFNLLYNLVTCEEGQDRDAICKEESICTKAVTTMNNIVLWEQTTRLQQRSNEKIARTDMLNMAMKSDALSVQEERGRMTIMDCQTQTRKAMYKVESGCQVPDGVITVDLRLVTRTESEADLRQQISGEEDAAWRSLRWFMMDLLQGWNDRRIHPTPAETRQAGLQRFVIELEQYTRELIEEHETAFHTIHFNNYTNRLEFDEMHFLSLGVDSLVWLLNERDMWRRDLCDVRKLCLETYEASLSVFKGVVVRRNFYENLQSKEHEERDEIEALQDDELVMILADRSEEREDTAFKTMSVYLGLEVTEGIHLRSGDTIDHEGRLRREGGLQVFSVALHGPADLAGVTISHIITHVNYKSVSTLVGFRNAVLSSPPGGILDVTVHCNVTGETQILPLSTLAVPSWSFRPGKRRTLGYRVPLTHAV